MSKQDTFYFRVHEDGLEQLASYAEAQPGDSVIQLRRDKALAMEHPQSVRMRRWDKLEPDRINAGLL